ncbi:hypothetical protein [Pseudomonas antarctica]|uniref:hypothetical protein n=1 Tax=Pseudomonas antarctica TaxID=219572 RepID=UPI003F74F9A8
MISSSEIVFLVCSLGLFMLGVFVVGVWIYMAFFKISEMVGCLGRSLVVQNRRAFLSAGVIGKLYLVSGISGVLIFPKKSIKKGELDPEDYRQFPKNLRLWIVCSTSAAVAISLVGLGMAMAIKFLGWPTPAL